MADGTTETRPTKRRVRKPVEFELVYPTESANDIDPATGAEIPGSAKRVYVRVPLPPIKGAVTRRSIERAVQKALFENGMKEYGNRPFRVAMLGPEFRFDFEEETVTRLVPKNKGK